MNKDKKWKKFVQHNEKRKTNYDLWDNENEKNATKEENDDFLDVAIHPPVKKPDTWIEKPSNIPSIEITAPGNSYRPLSDDHQDVLGETVAKLIKMEDEKKFWKKKLAFDKSKIVPEITVDDEIKIESELEDANNEILETTSVPVEWNKKTITDRNKEKRKSELGYELNEQKAKKRRLEDIDRLPEIINEIETKEAEIIKEKEHKERIKEEYKSKPKKLGKYNFEDVPEDVLLTSEIPSTLRTLKTQGNIYTDRFQSLQKRNIIEPRKLVKFRRRYERKTFEKSRN